MALASHRMAAIAGDGLALADERISLSWLELDAMLNRAANGLIARPMGGERRVAVFAANSSEAVICSGVTLVCSPFSSFSISTKGL